jgi:hypothetical protein
MSSDRVISKEKPLPLPLIRGSPLTPLGGSGNTTQHLNLFPPILSIRHVRLPTTDKFVEAT